MDIEDRGKSLDEGAREHVHPTEQQDELGFAARDERQQLFVIGFTREGRTIPNQRPGGIPARRARSSAKASARLAMTLHSSRATKPSSIASITVCRFVPPPEARTVVRRLTRPRAQGGRRPADRRAIASRSSRRLWLAGPRAALSRRLGAGR